MPEQVKFTKFKNDTMEALALDKMSVNENTKTLTAYSSNNANIKEEIVLPFASNTELSALQTNINNFKSEINLKVGSPLVANTTSAMIDTTKIYVYTGNQSGYTNGNWYYYDGANWVSGGTYNSSALETDTSLSVSGAAGDAKATGDAINLINQEIDDAVHGTGVTNIISISEAQFNALLQKDNSTLYVVGG